MKVPFNNIEPYMFSIFMFFMGLISFIVIIATGFVVVYESIFNYLIGVKDESTV
jgi:CDP-diglyceride synthetase